MGTVNKLDNKGNFYVLVLEKGFGLQVEEMECEEWSSTHLLMFFSLLTISILADSVIEDERETLNAVPVY